MASGGGSNLEALLEACAHGDVCADIVGVVCNRSQAFALERARRRGISAECLSLGAVRASGGTREDYDERLADMVARHRPDLVVLAGFMHVLSRRFLERFPTDFVVNLHPSLLPDDPEEDEVQIDGRRYRAFRGADALEQALAAGASVTGTTVHLVTPEVDRGRVVARTTVEVHADDTLERLRERVQMAEHGLLPRAVEAVLRERGFDTGSR
ncbi:MAG: phosphoribosylglycinamide formyltransferase [Proteobacteria bacterium]|nr:phosphoribosylglycinamide formyltransferase [Pseudomonadota bacterium]